MEYGADLVLYFESTLLLYMITTSSANCPYYGPYCNELNRQSIGKMVECAIKGGIHV
jgi:hypothetical protein